MKVDDLRPALSYCNLTVRQLALILLMRDAPKLFLKDIAIRLQVARPVISRSWDTLGTLGFIKRVRDEDDRRMVSAVLTDKGKKFAEEM